MNRIINAIKKPNRILLYLLSRRWIQRLFGDKTYLKVIFKLNLGYRLNLEHPCTFNEKLQWLKLHDRKPIYTKMVDKYAVKKLVAEKIGEEYIIPTLGVWEQFEDIDFSKLPKQFVLKTTHDSGTIAICKNKDEFIKNTIEKTKKQFKQRMKYNYFYHTREWPYKNVKPRIIAEKFMQDRDFDVLNVYKVFNFNYGEQIIQTIQNDKTPRETIDYFDSNWNRLELKQNYSNSEIPLPKPKNLEKMLYLAKKLSEGFAFLRTDFYEINGKLYFSEFTFYSDAGLAKFEPKIWDEFLGERVRLK